MLAIRCIQANSRENFTEGKSYAIYFNEEQRFYIKDDKGNKLLSNGAQHKISVETLVDTLKLENYSRFELIRDIEPKKTSNAFTQDEIKRYLQDKVEKYTQKLEQLNDENEEGLLDASIAGLQFILKDTKETLDDLFPDDLGYFMCEESYSMFWSTGKIYPIYHTEHNGYYVVDDDGDTRAYDNKSELIRDMTEYKLSDFKYFLSNSEQNR